MNNIFVVGSEVTGESQIGYNRYIENFTDTLLNTKNNISITGLKRFGKTSLAKEVLRLVKAKSGNRVLVVFIDLATQKSFTKLLITIVDCLEEALLENNLQDILANKIYQLYIDKISKTKPKTQTYRNHINSIFKTITKLGYKIILAIDEFDAAGILFKDTADYEFLRDLSSNKDIGVSLVLVSRRQLYMIEKKNFNNSTFHGIVQTEPIEGFDEDDFGLFYKILKEKYNIVVSDSDKEKLNYYCGRSPFLVSMFAYDIVDKFLKNHAYDVDEIYAHRAIDVENYYNSIFACLNNDKITVEGAYEETSTIEKLMGIIVGPKIGVVEKDITVLKSMGYLYAEGEKYMSISKHFTNVLRNYPFTVDTWKAIIDAEKLIKSMIRKQIMDNKKVEFISYDIWEDIFEKIGASNSLGIYDNFVEDSMKTYKRDVDILDVCGFDVAVSILQFYWRDWFDEIFNREGWEKWEEKFRLCARARNPMAHGHEDFLSSEERAYVNSFCIEIEKILKEKNACLDIETEMRIKNNNLLAELSKKYHEISDYSATVDNSLVGVIVDFTAAVADVKSVKGYFSIKKQLYKCTMGKQKWQKKFPGRHHSEFLGQNFKVKITSVNINPKTGINTVNCEFC